MIQKNIGIINYGVGNHSSVINTVKSLGHLVTLSSKINELDKCEILLLPGVGSFSVAMNGLEKFALINFIKNWAKEKKPIIGICLGMQVMATTGTEGGICDGLDILPGEVNKISNNEAHIGWNSLQISKNINFLNDFNGKDFYFNHSYKFKTNLNLVSAIVKFGEDIPAIIINDSVIGLQFHPEKSQKNGSNLLIKLINGFN